MDRKEFEDKIKEIGTCEDEVKRRELLTELNDSAVSVFDDNETLRAENTKQKEDNEKLIESNRKYFMRLETQRTSKQELEDNTGIQEQEKKEYKSYDEIMKGLKL